MKELKNFLKTINYKKQPDSNLVKEIRQKQDYIKKNCLNNEEDAKKKIDEIVELSGHYTTVPNNNRIDLTVKYNNEPVAIFEVKAPGNKSEMISPSDINRKALYETIINLLEMRERGEFPLYVIITNGIVWYVMSAEALLFYLDTEIKNPDIRTALGLTNNRQTLPFSKQVNFNKKDKYRILSQYLGKEVDFLTQCLKNIFFFSKPKDVSTFLSEDILAQQYNPNAGNELNNDFYKELLYIFGLKEEKKGSKKRIIPNNVQNTFYHQISSKLKIKYPSLKKDELYEMTLELIIIWLNRILFLKLFEGRLILFNGGDKKFRFMNVDKITTTTKLKQLFFEVLAVPVKERINKNFDYIPYLNSSLFDEKDVEQSISVSDIAGDEEIPYYDQTVLLDANGKRKKGNVKLLDYLFEFLDAFDFSREQNGDLLRQSDLISPAVLGLIFEKINGYKEGSFYTPTEVTDYMAREAIEKEIVLKVNKILNKKYETYGDLKSAFFRDLTKEERNKVKEIIGNIKILDPAVGSAHFLVSALNTLLYIKWDLGIIDNQTNLDLKRFNVTFKNGDLMFTDMGKPFIYRRNEPETQTFQEFLFNAKKIIIENNLFGVDINPKAVEIARLRMWIELLKNAYYKSNGIMETLPNIDINIKQGDSLSAPILQEGKNQMFEEGSMLGYLKKKEIDIAQYKRLFKTYQNTTGQSKQNIKKEIQKLREKIITTIYEGFAKKMENMLIWNVDFPQTIDEDGSFIGFDVIIANPPYGILCKNVEGYESAVSIPQKKIRGSYDSYVLFIEKGVKLLQPEGILHYIVPISVISSDSVSALHELIRKSCTVIKVSSFAVRPQQIFDSAVVNVSIFNLIKGNSKEFKVFTTKMYRKSKDNPLEKIINNLKFIEVTDFYRNGRYPKISKEIEVSILNKVLNQPNTVGSLERKDTGVPIYYRTAGGRYFKIITPCSTKSSAEQSLSFEEKIAKTIGAIMSSNLFFWFYQIYSDNLNLKQSDISPFGIPYKKLTDSVISKIEKVYDKYLEDIKKHVIVHKNSNYKNAKTFREYKIRLSKKYIDKIDDIIGPLYGLTPEEIEFIKKYEIDFRK